MLNERDMSIETGLGKFIAEEYCLDNCLSCAEEHVTLRFEYTIHVY